jgi:hypothetical protein
MRAAPNQEWERFQRRPGRFRFAEALGVFPIVLLLPLSGCVTPQAEGKKLKASGQEAPVAIVKPGENEKAHPEKQETLAAVEEFLSRTQEYRFPAKGEPIGASVPTPSSSIGSSPVQPTGNPQAVSPPPRDAAYANAQISLGDQSAPVTPQAIPAIESVSIRSSPAKSNPPSASPKPRVTNGPIELQSSDKGDSMDLLVASLKEELKTKKDVATEWKLRAFLLALDLDADEATITDNAPSELKGILPAWSAASAAVRNLLRNPAQGSESAVERIDSLRGLLRVLSEPRVKSVALCRKVVTFGSYEEMPPDEFVSGRSIQTIVYAEIENLRASAESNGVFETKLSTRLEVLTAEGKSMWQREEPEVIDRCRRPRRDFFVAQRITLPPTLPVGEYVLKFSMEDKTSGMIAESSATFSLQSPISVAKGQ